MNPSTASDLRRNKRRRAMLLAASEVFAAFGFDQANMQAIADSAGVTKATLYAHFDDKAQLYRSVIDYWLEQLPEPKLPTQARGELRNCLEIAAHALLLQNQHAATRALTYIALRSNQIEQKRWRQRYLPYQRYLENALSRSPRCLAPKQAAIEFLLLAVGSIDCSNPVAVSEARLAAAVETCARAYA